MNDVAEKDPYLPELGQFLRARRSGLTPDDLGLAERDGGVRRVPGLRREEVAARVAISTDYLIRIEQGRLAPSEPVLDALAHCLRLTPDHRDYVEGFDAVTGRDRGVGEDVQLSATSTLGHDEARPGAPAGELPRAARAGRVSLLRTPARPVASCAADRAALGRSRREAHGAPLCGRCRLRAGRGRQGEREAGPST